jgi:hypothetical protein
LHYGNPRDGSYSEGQQSSSRGGYVPRGRVVGISRGGKRPSAENTCHKCGATDHFFKSCTKK